MSNFQLEHLNLPACDPDAQVRWYANTFGLQADGNKARGPGILIVFMPGEPVKRSPELHVGFRVSGNKSLNEWALKFGMPVKQGEEFNAFQIRDPEDNCLEIYCGKSDH